MRGRKPGESFERNGNYLSELKAHKRNPLAPRCSAPRSPKILTDVFGPGLPKATQKHPARNPVSVIKNQFEC